MHPTGQWLPVNTMNSGIEDAVGSIPPGHQTPFSFGTFIWAIPQTWRIAGSGGRGIPYSTAYEILVMVPGASGEETTSKEGADRTRTP